MACAAAFYAAFHVIGKPRVVAAGYGWVVFASTVLIFVLAFLGLAYSLYPYIVIDRLTVWQAASATKSLMFIFVGVAITLPAIIVYTIFMYRVFWGRARRSARHRRPGSVEPGMLKSVLSRPRALRVAAAAAAARPGTRASGAPPVPPCW